MRGSLDVRVRDAVAGDAPAIAAMNARLAGESEDRVPDAAVLRRGVERGLARPDLCRYFVAEVDGAIVGQAMVTLEWSDWRDGVVWWFQSVYVQPAHRARGVFRTIYRHVEASARADGDVRGLRLYVETDNETARAVYTRLGMERTGYLVYEVDWSDAWGDGEGGGDAARDTRNASRT